MTPNKKADRWHRIDSMDALRRPGLCHHGTRNSDLCSRATSVSDRLRRNPLYTSISSLTVHKPISNITESLWSTLSTTEYRCALCYGGRPFRTIYALQAHIASPAHGPKMFHCPLVLVQQLVQRGHDTLPKPFSTLSRLVQHLESGACAGGKETLRLAASVFEKRLSDAWFRQIRLLK